MPGGLLEPNQLTGNENCAVANYSQSYDGAWGWADIPCETLHASVCKIAGGETAAPLLHMHTGRCSWCFCLACTHILKPWCSLC